MPKIEEFYNPKEGHDLEEVIDLLLAAEENKKVIVIEDYVKSTGEVVGHLSFFFPKHTYLQMFFLAHERYSDILRKLDLEQAFLNLKKHDAEKLEDSEEWRKVQKKIYDVLGDASKYIERDVHRSPSSRDPDSEACIRRYGRGGHILLPDESSVILKGVLYTDQMIPEPTEVHAWVKWKSGLGRYRNLELRPGRFKSISIQS